MSAGRQVVIRAIRLADLPAAQRLEVATFTAYRISARQMRRFARSRSAIFLAAFSGGSLVGDAIALVRKHPTGAKSGRVYSLAVDPKSRGQGIGRRLTSRLLKELAHRGASRVYLEVATTNTKAVSLYKTLGFEIARELSNYYGRGEHAFKMRMNLR